MGKKRSSSTGTGLGHADDDVAQPGGEVTRFFDGLNVLDPGVVPCPQWRPVIGQLGGQPAPVDEFPAWPAEL